MTGHGAELPARRTSPDVSDDCIPSRSFGGLEREAVKENLAVTENLDSRLVFGNGLY